MFSFSLAREEEYRVQKNLVGAKFRSILVTLLSGLMFVQWPILRKDLTLSCLLTENKF